MHRCPPLIFCALVAVQLAGCAKQTYPVEGKVVLKGETAPCKDLVGYVINLESMDRKPPVSASAEVKADGTFQVGTFQGDDGAMPGKYRVAVTFLQEEGGPPPKKRIATRYGRFETSDLEVEIKPQRNEITLELEPLKK